MSTTLHSSGAFGGVPSLRYISSDDLLSDDSVHPFVYKRYEVPRRRTVLAFADPVGAIQNEIKTSRQNLYWRLMSYFENCGCR